jgi:N-acetylglucosaminyl-diphospho-decaprenol L-rhamnosyltransferase
LGDPQDTQARAVRARSASGNAEDVSSASARAATVDVAIVSYNSRDRLRDCVGRLAHAEDVSVVVVDNASADGSLDAIADLPVTRIALDRNLGFGGGSNVAWRAGSAPYVLLLNPDTRLEPAALHRLVEVLEETGAGIVAPRILREDGSLDWSLRRFPEVRSIFGQALFAHRFFPQASWVDEVIRDPKAYDHPHSCDWAPAACLLARRELLERLGGLDETFFMYCEDIDLCRRAWNAGFAVHYTPEVICVHAGGASAPRTDLVPVLVRSRINYARKHFTRGRALAYRIGVGLNEVTHVVLSRSGRARIGHARALAPVVRG